MRDKDVSKTEGLILEAGFVVLSRNPGASLSDVAEEAAVGRATLHRYFPSRSDLVTALARVALAELNKAVERATAPASSYVEALQLAMGAVIPLAHRHMFLMQETLFDASIQTEFEAEAQELRSLIENAKSEGTLRTDLPTEWIAQAYEHLVYAAWEMIRREEATPRQAVELAWTQFAKGAAHDT